MDSFESIALHLQAGRLFCLVSEIFPVATDTAISEDAIIRADMTERGPSDPIER